MRRYLKLFDFDYTYSAKTEILSGLTVALALVPEVVALARITTAEAIIEVSVTEDSTLKVVCGFS